MSIYGDTTPDEVKNAKGIHLLTTNTPNGQKVQIMLEELKELYGTEWTTTLIDLEAKEQKQDWFHRLNPNGRIPVIVDNNQIPPLPIFETSSITVYLHNTYDKKHELGFTDPIEHIQSLQWLFFWHGSGVILQQWLFFARRATEKIPSVISRFQQEGLRIVEVAEIQLSGKHTNEPREYLAGNGKGKYSIADIGAWAYIKELKHLPEFGTSEEQKARFPHLLKYIDRIAQRPAVQRGIGKDYDQQE
ncbi:hypothetical protein MMC31_005795 [Peltigera leucophlebia]|nr:hypothetical protein [Peltigera leucophlebia]